MSDKIYFSSEPVNKDFKWYLVRIGAEIYRRAAPVSAARRSRALLLKPSRSTGKQLPAYIHEQKIHTDYGELATYHTGSGPNVLFVHGWSGSAHQFFPLMNSVASQGFRAISFDHFAHGQSGNNEANLPVLIKGVDYAKNHYNLNSDLAAVVSHSLGAVASMNSFSKSSAPQFLIAPVFNFVETFYAVVRKSGLPIIMLDDLIASIESEHNVKIESLDINDRIAQYKGSIEIAHDQSDKLSDYRFSQQAEQTYPFIRLHTTENLGHNSILSASEVHELVNQFLSSKAPNQENSMGHEFA